MSLRLLLDRIGRHTKQDVQDSASVACILAELNTIAEDLHVSHDLEGTIHQVVFDLGESPDKVVTFPWNVDYVIASRYVQDYDNPIPLSKVGINISHNSEFRNWKRMPITELTRAAPFPEEYD